MQYFYSYDVDRVVDEQQLTMEDHWKKSQEISPVLLGSKRSSRILHSLSVKQLARLALWMFLWPGSQKLLKTTYLSVCFHQLAILASFLSSSASRSSSSPSVSGESLLYLLYLMNAQQRCSQSWGTMYLTKLVKLQLPYFLLRISSKSCPLLSYISSRSQSPWYSNCLFISLSFSSWARMLARIESSLSGTSGHSSPMNLDTSIALLLSEWRRSALVSLVELTPAYLAVLPLGVVNLSSSSCLNSNFFFLMEEQNILVCCWYLPLLAVTLNHLLKVVSSMGRENLRPIILKKSSGFRSPTMRKRFFSWWTPISPSLLSTSNRSVMFLQ